MDHELTQISVDLLLIARVLAAFSWGVGWAAFLQFNRQGQFLAERRTWITVVIGVGLDLLIAYPGDWWTVVLIISFSSLGVIFRSLWNEAQGVVSPSSYKLKHHLEDIAALTDTAIDQLTALLDANLSGAHVAAVSRILANIHQIHDHVIDARNGR